MVGTDNALLAGTINITEGAIDNVTLVDTTTTNTDMRGTDSANTVVPMTAALSQTEHDATQTAITALNDISAADILTSQLTESYNTDGTAPTLTQALMMIMQDLGEFSISGTTITVKKLDGSTTAATFTLDDGTNPTSKTRAS